jgi:hypothetical protein
METLQQLETALSIQSTADEIGAMLAEALNLKRDKEHKDRWVTDWGTKTNAGLARTVFSLMTAKVDEIIARGAADTE